MPLGLVQPLMLRPLLADGDYRHMAHRDRDVWERWLATHAGEYQGVAYDVAIGGLAAPDPDATIAEQRAWQYATALKVDAFVVGVDRVLVVEVRPSATVSAIGAALTYALVLDRIGVGDLPLMPAIVCESIQVDVRWACDKLNIQVFEV